jgi:glycosyltransferase involved in cell wall biosynthesis
MRIAINCQNISVKNAAGPDVYLINIIQHLAKIDKQNSYFLILPAGDFLSLKDLGVENPNFSLVYLRKILSYTHVSLALHLIRAKYDVYFTSYHTLPLFRTPKTKYIVMIHGLEYLTNGIKKLFVGLPERFAAQAANRIIVPSAHVKNSLVEKKFAPEDKITVIHEGVGEEFFKRDDTEVEKVKKKYGIAKRYILFVSTIQPRKNLPRTIEAFSILSHYETYKDLIFVISGKQGWKYEESLNAPIKYGVQNRVKYIGHSSSDDLPALYSGCSLFANFSLDEGFGLPLLEAYRCGAVCAVSDIPAFREIGADLAFYANPTSIESLKSTMSYAINIDKEEHNKLYEKKVLYTKDFTWEITAQKTLNTFVELTKSS